MEKKIDGIREDISEMKETQIAIEKDLKYHIKRTDELQNMTAPMYKAYIFVSYLIKALVPLSIMIGIWFKMK